MGLCSNHVNPINFEKLVNIVLSSNAHTKRMIYLVNNNWTDV